LPTINLLLVPILALAACHTAAINVMPAPNAPMFAGAGDIQAAGSMSTERQFDAQAALLR
jgi:hypothetical protein